MITSEYGKKGATIGQRMIELGTRDVLKRRLDYGRAALDRGSRTGFHRDELGMSEGERYAMNIDNQYMGLPPHMRSGSSTLFGGGVLSYKDAGQQGAKLIMDGMNYLGERIGLGGGGKNESSSTAEQSNQDGKSWFNLSFSDSTLKDNVETIPNALEKIESLRGVHFTWKDTNQAQMGVIAQELEQVYPELVHETEEGVKMVEYSSLIGVLIEAVKDLNKQVKLQKVGV